MNENVDLFICSHKEFEPKVTSDVYKVIYSKEGIKHNGELKSFYVNTSELPLDDRFFSELYMFHHVWKNMDLKDYVGFCHYRKYFKFMDKVPNIEEAFQKCDVMVAKPLVFGYNIERQWELCHNPYDLDLLLSIIKRKYPKYMPQTEKWLGTKIMIPYNMFIMKKDDFKHYCEFVFDVIDEFLKLTTLDIETRIENNKEKYLKTKYPRSEPWYQYRIGGYLGERLTNIFIFNNFKNLNLLSVKITEEKYKNDKKQDGNVK